MSWPYMIAADPRLYPYLMNQAASAAVYPPPQYPYSVPGGFPPPHLSPMQPPHLNYYSTELQRAAAAANSSFPIRPPTFDLLQMSAAFSRDQQSRDQQSRDLIPSLPSSGSSSVPPFFGHIPGLCPAPLTGEPCRCHQVLLGHSSLVPPPPSQHSSSSLTRNIVTSALCQRTPSKFEFSPTNSFSAPLLADGERVKQNDCWTLLAQHGVVCKLSLCFISILILRLINTAVEDLANHVWINTCEP